MFHPGELAIQEATGVREVAAANSRLIWRSVPDHVVPFVTAQSYCVIGGVSGDGNTWAEFVVGTEGFAAIHDGGATVTMSLTSASGSKPQLDLAVGHYLGVLFIDLATRKRLRVNGRIASISGQMLTLSVEQSYPNCPKYVQATRLTVSSTTTGPKGTVAGSTITPEVSNWIATADMFFVASATINGQADVSHRGGKPGFVKINGQTLFIPDYPGNSMFSTLGNFLLRPLAGLTFLDFETNRMLQLTGDIELEFDALGGMPASMDTGRWWAFKARKFVISSMSKEVSAEFIDASPFNPAVMPYPLKSVR